MRTVTLWIVVAGLAGSAATAAHPVCERIFPAARSSFLNQGASSNRTV